MAVLSKPAGVHGRQVAVYVNSIPLNRVQTFDFTSNFDIEQVYELANTGLVQDIVNNVETGITLTTTLWGTTDLEALLFGGLATIITVTGTVTATGFNGTRGNHKGGVPFTTSSLWAKVCKLSGTMSQSFIQIQATQAAVNPKYTRYRIAATYAWDARPTLGDKVMISNRYTITQDDFADSRVNFIVPYRHRLSATVMMHSVLIPNARPTDLTYRFDSGGGSEISLSLVADQLRWTLGTQREIQEQVCAFTSYITNQLKVNVPDKSLAKTIGQPYYFVAGDVVATKSAISNAANATLVTITTQSGLGLSASDSYRYIYANGTPSYKGFRAVKTMTNAFGKLQKGHIEVCIGTTGGYATIKRVTSVEISCPIGRDALAELNAENIISRPTTNPFRGEVRLTFTESDLQSYALLLGGSKYASYNSGTIKEILMSDLRAVKDGKIKVNLYNHQTNRSPITNRLVTYELTGCNFVGDNRTNTPGGNSIHEVTLSSGNITITGNKLPARTL